MDIIYLGPLTLYLLYKVISFIIEKRCRSKRTYKEIFKDKALLTTIIFIIILITILVIY